MRQGPATARMSSTTRTGHRKRAMVLLPSWPAGPHPLERVPPARGPHSGRAEAKSKGPSCVSGPAPRWATLDLHGRTCVTSPFAGTAVATCPTPPLTPEAPWHSPALAVRASRLPPMPPGLSRLALVTCGSPWRCPTLLPYICGPTPRGSTRA